MATTTRKVGSLDIQFDQSFDQQKGNQLIQSLQQTISAVNYANSQIAALQTTTAGMSGTVAKHVLASEDGIGASHTVSGLYVGQVLIAISDSDVAFGSLKFSQLAGVDPNSFESPAQGDVIAFIDGYWTASASAALGGLTYPGMNALLMYNEPTTALAWAFPSTGITLSAGALAVNDRQLTHGHLLGLLADDHPQYALTGAVNTYADLQTFTSGLTSNGVLTLVGNLEQSAAYEPEQRIQNLDDSTDEGTWRMHIEPGQWMAATVADDGSDGEEWLCVTRVAESANAVNINAGYLTFNGDDIVAGSVVAGHGGIGTTIDGYVFALIGGTAVKLLYRNP